MEREKIKQKIISYIDTAYEWHEAGEGSLAETVGKKMVDLEEEILSSFGLPFMAQQYSDIMQVEGFSNENKEQKAEELVEILKYEAQKFLLVPIKKDTKILANAKSQLQDAVEVLPIIGITATAYNCFLYYDIFFRAIYNEEEVLLALRKNEQLDKLPETRIPHTYEALIAGKNFERLNEAGLPFLNEYREFLKYSETRHYWDEHSGNYDLGNYFGLPDILELEHFIVKHIHLKEDSSCCITVIITFGKATLVELILWCTASIMRVIMLHAKYYSLAIPPLYILSPKFLDEGVVNIQIRKAIGKNIEIENVKIELERCDNVDGGIQNPFEYLVTKINA